MNRIAASLHPFLFATLVVLLGCRELQPYTSVSEFLQVWALMLAGTAGSVWLARKLFGRASDKGVLVVTVALVGVFFFEAIVYHLRQWGAWLSLDRLVRARYVLGLELLGFGMFVWRVHRTARPLHRLHAYLNVTGTLLVLFTAAQVGGLIHPRPAVPTPLARPTVRLQPARPSPDIYFLVLDGYTSVESLRKYWGYDNAALCGFLAAHGFQVMTNARSNYDLTQFSLSATLNMDYVGSAPAHFSIYAENARLLDLLRQAQVPRLLEQAGYEVVNLSLFDLPGRPKAYVFPFVTDLSLRTIIIHQSVFGWIKSYFQRRAFADVNLAMFSRLEALARQPSSRPRFVYAHLMMPHYPFLFDREGRRVVKGMGGVKDPQDYLDQLMFTNRLLTNTVAQLLAHSKQPPIIIVQGDHGFRDLPDPQQSADEGNTILYAYHLPGVRPDSIPSDITPVNSFRLVFNRFFGTSLPYLPNQYHRGYNRPTDHCSVAAPATGSGSKPVPVPKRVSGRGAG